MSQLLTRLESELASTTDPARCAEITARIAANLARLGCFEEANARIGDLRQVYGDGRSGPVTAWIMLAEGLVHLYRDLSPAALDRIARANLLGVAMGHSELIAVASAWKAHVEFEMSRFTDMFKSLQVGLKHLSHDSHDAHTRISMVLSNCYMLCGDFESAQHWFLRGRDHALKNGDQASVEALLYNRAAFGLAALRLRSCDHPPQPEELRRTRAEIKSSRNLQDLTQITALTNHIHLADARLLILEGEYARAIHEFEKVRNRAPFANHNFTQPFIDLEICFCLFRKGEVEAALDAYRVLDDCEFSTLDLDEQVVAEWMRLEMSQVDPRFGSSSFHRNKYQALQKRYGVLSLELKESLERIVHSE